MSLGEEMAFLFVFGSKQTRLLFILQLRCLSGSLTILNIRQYKSWNKIAMENIGTKEANAGDNDKTTIKDSDYLQSPGGHKLFCKYWYPKLEEGDTLRALVFLCHGVGEHCQVYDKMAKALTNEGCLVFSHDHVGHGLSDGDRVHINDFNVYVVDVMTHVNKMKEKHPEVSCFIIGHSMGGAIAIKTALDNKTAFAGIVLIGPAITSHPDTASPFKVCLAKAVASLIPQLQVGSIQPEWLSRDPEVGKRYMEDPLTWHGGLKARWAVCMLNVMNEIQDRFAEMEWPFFILHGDHDKLCSLEGSQLMHDKASSKDKTLKVYEGAYHQIHEEADGQGEEAISDIVDWITRV